MDWFDTRLIGEATLILIGAIVFGYAVGRLWPKRLHPEFFGTLAALAVVGALAWWGSSAAGLALAVLILIVVAFAIAAVAL
ncbi:MAG: hypothetical protein NW205_11270 [Hyphomicrobiaceae bacterium]|nr:hypothetical protein [Hyphomicrobiaceae bacterium]